MNLDELILIIFMSALTIRDDSKTFGDRIYEGDSEKNKMI